MNRRDFLKAGAIAPATAIAGNAEQHQDLFRITVDGGVVILDSAAKKMLVEGEPHLWEFFVKVEELYQQGKIASRAAAMVTYDFYSDGDLLPQKATVGDLRRGDHFIYDLLYDVDEQDAMKFTGGCVQNFDFATVYIVGLDKCDAYYVNGGRVYPDRLMQLRLPFYEVQNRESVQFIGVRESHCSVFDYKVHKSIDKIMHAIPL